MGIVTARDQFVIDFNRRELKNRILQFKNLSQPDEILAQAFNLKDKSNWKIQDARKNVTNITDLDTTIKEILYRPFDRRYIFYHQAVIERMRPEVMRHMLEENIGLAIGRQGQVVGLEHLWNLVFISENIIDFNLYYRGGELLFPLYIYPDKEKNNPKRVSTIMMAFEPQAKYSQRIPNIDDNLFKMLTKNYGKKPTPEKILYYIYGVFYSTIYRETYAEFLKIDFPRVPFSSNYDLFKKMGDLGKKLADLHLLKSPALDPPVAKYQGSGDNDRIGKIIYKEDEQRIYINNDKFFEGIKSEVWNYHIGGYQVLQKYLKDRKGRLMDDAPRYCRIVTAISKTIKIQKHIDKIYPKIEKKLINF